MRLLVIPLLLFAVSSRLEARPHFEDDESLYENLNKTLLEIAQTPADDLTIEEISAAYGKHIPPEHRAAAVELLKYKEDRSLGELMRDLQSYGKYDTKMAEEFSRGAMRALLDKSFILPASRKLQPGDHLCRCNQRECSSIHNELYAVIGPEMQSFCRVDKYGHCMEAPLHNDGTNKLLYCAVSHATVEQIVHHNTEDYEHNHVCKLPPKDGRKCCTGVMCNDSPAPLDIIYEDKLMELGKSLTIWRIMGVGFIMVSLILLTLLLITLFFFRRFGNWDEIMKRFPVVADRPWKSMEGKLGKRFFNESTEGSNAGSESPLIPPSLNLSLEGGTTAATGSSSKTTKSFCDMETTIGCGTGAGGNLVAQRTLSSFIRITQTLGQGKFGKVFLGEWRGGEKIAVKKFDHVLYDSFEQEVEILMSGMMSNSNILRWIGKDTVDTGSATEFWIMSEYHPNGSLFDYMEKNPLSEMTLLMMMRGIANGISFLHSEIPENEGTTGKRGVAHRDLKTKNILVKSDLTCVIADFGMAVIHKEDGVKLPPGTRKSGTVRYLSPEVLNDTIPSVSEFEFYRSSDMYSFGLIMWECARRTNAHFDDVKIPAYSMDDSLVYYLDVPREPTVADMKEAVWVKELRPHIPDMWRKNAIFLELSRIMRECWSVNASARLSALNVKIAIDRLALNLDLILPSGFD